MRRFLAQCFLLALSLLPLRAVAYPWMIRHGQTGCSSCHSDPSGGGILTPYGRAQSQLLLPPRPSEASGEEIKEGGGFLFNAVKLPDWLNLGVSVRAGAIYNRATGISSVRPVQMITDLRAGVDYGPFQAVGTVGYSIRGALQAALTGAPDNNLVSREHWVGLSSEDDAIRVRAGRITIPFGLRVPEHTTWVRQATRTDLNEQQQHGVALAYSGDQVRAEAMAILGNFQLHPAEYRERGGAGFVEWAPLGNLALGLSTLVAYAHYDLETRESSVIRQAHGLFARWAPVLPVVLMMEVDVLLAAPLGQPLHLGAVSLLQVDWEIIQGIHLIGTAESLHQSARSHVGGWVSAAYFILPQLEVRLDATYRSLQGDTQRTSLFTLLGQVHLSL